MPHIHVVKLSQASVSDVEQADQGGFLGGHLLYIFFFFFLFQLFNAELLPTSNTNYINDKKNTL